MDDRPHTLLAFYRYGYTSAAFGILSRASGLLGRGISLAIARSLGHFYAGSHPAVVETVRDNLRLLGGSEVSRQAAEEVFVKFASTLADYFWLASQSPSDGWELAHLDGGWDEVAAARDAGKGVILATGHFGFFEFGALVLGRLGYPVSIVTNPEPSDSLTRWRAAYRRRWGAETIELGTDAMASLRVNEALERGRFTAMLVDRPAGGRNEEVDFPGGRLLFSQSPALLSWMSGCAVLPVSVRRTESGRYAMCARQLIRCDRSLPRPEAISLCTRQIAEALLGEFQKDPSQWYQFLPLSPSCSEN